MQLLLVVAVLLGHQVRKMEATVVIQCLALLPLMVVALELDWHLVALRLLAETEVQVAVA
jgi:hypothetical protein